MRRSPLEGRTLSYGFGAGYRYITGDGWQSLARLTWSAAPDAGVSTGYFDLGATVGAGRRWPIGGAWLGTDLLLGYEHISNPKRSARCCGSVSHSAAATSGSAAKTAFPLWM